MKEPAMVLNLSDLPTKRKLMQRVSTLSGLYEVTLKPRKRVRSLNQNSYYWIAFCQPFTEWLRDQWGDDSITIDDAHQMLKERLLKPRECVNLNTGEIMQLPASSAKLDTKEFSDYLERAAQWLAEFAGIVVLPTSAYFEPTSSASAPSVESGSSRRHPQRQAAESESSSTYAGDRRTGTTYQTPRVPMLAG